MTIMQIITDNTDGNLSLKMPMRVYLEDTDVGGIVYHSRYVNFAERCRTEWVRLKGVESQQQYAQENDTYFVVKSLNIDYKSPAVLDDILTISCQVSDYKKASITFEQKVMRDDVIIAELNVVVACINKKGRVVRLPIKMK